MTIFDDYIRNKGCCKVSKTLLWDYDLTQFDWQRSRKVVVQRIIERGWLRDVLRGVRPLRRHRRLPGNYQRGSDTLGAGYEFRMYGFRP